MKALRTITPYFLPSSPQQFTSRIPAIDAGCRAGLDGRPRGLHRAAQRPAERHEAKRAGIYRDEPLDPSESLCVAGRKCESSDRCFILTIRRSAALGVRTVTMAGNGECLRYTFHSLEIIGWGGWSVRPRCIWQRRRRGGEADFSFFSTDKMREAPISIYFSISGPRNHLKINIESS